MATGEVVLNRPYIESDHYGDDGRLFASQTLTGVIKNNYTGFLGSRVTVQATPLVCSQIGLFKLEDSNNTHVLQIRASNGSTVLATVTVDFTDKSCGAYVYGTLTTPITLSASTNYFIVAQYTSGGDKWYDEVPIVAAAGITGIVAAYGDAGMGLLI